MTWLRIVQCTGTSSEKFGRSVSLGGGGGLQSLTDVKPCLWNTVSKRKAVASSCLTTSQIVNGAGAFHFMDFGQYRTSLNSTQNGWTLLTTQHNTLSPQIRSFFPPITYDAVHPVSQLSITSGSAAGHACGRGSIPGSPRNKSFIRLWGFGQTGNSPIDRTDEPYIADGRMLTTQFPPSTGCVFADICALAPLHYTNTASRSQ